MSTQNDFEKVAAALRADAESHPAPASLEPEAIAKRLSTEAAETGAAVSPETAAFTVVPKDGPAPRRTSRRWPVAVAASVALLAGVGVVAAVALNGAPFGPFNTGFDPAPDALPQNDLNAADLSALEDAADATAEDPFATAQSYEEIRACLVASQEAATQASTFMADGAAANSARAEIAATEMEGLSSAKSATSFTDTNVRTDGVGEADSVKTDGNRLYVMQDDARTITIVDPGDGHMSELGTIAMEGDAQLSEFYLEGSRLLAFCTVYPEGKEQPDGTFTFEPPHTRMDTYDVSDPANPTRIASISQSGSYRTARVADGYAYLFSDQWEMDTESRENPAAYTPTVDGEVMKCGNIYLPPDGMGNSYLVITSVKLDDPGTVVDQKAILGQSGDVYMSGENIFAYETTGQHYNFVPLARMETAEDDATSDEASNGPTVETCIRKFTFKDGKLQGDAQVKLAGMVDDSFSLDEFDGHLRVVTTVYDADGNTENALYVLNDQLEETGRIDNIAPGEQVYSARFLGETGYFVTFKQVDPLFSVDLSDPANPRIIGELKIPGFSEYLHPYGDGLLLGIGMSADDAGATDGLKLSMFDVSDPTNVTEVATSVLDQVYYSDVFTSYKAALIEPETDIIGFAIDGGDGPEYCVFGYNNDAFDQKMREHVNNTGWLSTRGVRIGDVLYVIGSNALESHRIGSYEKIDDLLI
ncbi:MAG: hypothetical protein HFJ66_05030 [Eggerthellaceae bacterium]|nr:hypothetical protein [Eggerthellaceae bacterium]